MTSQTTAMFVLDDDDGPIPLIARRPKLGWIVPACDARNRRPRLTGRTGRRSPAEAWAAPANAARHHPRSW